MCLRECVKERKMPVRGELTDINPVSIFLFVHIRRCWNLGQILLLVASRKGADFVITSGARQWFSTLDTYSC